MVAFYAIKQEKSIFSTNKKSLTVLAESVAKGLEALMLEGYADIAHSYLEQIKKVGHFDSFNIVRTDGMQAFLDNGTINNVNKHLGEIDYLPRRIEKSNRLLAVDDSWLLTVLEKRRSVSFQTTDGDAKAITVFVPILNNKKCYKCHGSEHGVRGILVIRSSVSKVYEKVRRSQQQAGLILLLVLIVGGGILYFVMGASIVRPIKEIAQGLAGAADGDYSTEIAISSKAGFGNLALNFNKIILQIRTSNKTLKQQENTLITIIQGVRDGMVVADESRQVIIVNTGAEAILGKSKQQVIAGGFLNIFDDQELINSVAMDSIGKKVKIVEYNGKVLQCYITSPQRDREGKIGSILMLHDVTTNRRRHERLRSLSYSDALTGLYNFRWMEEILAKEYKRCRRQSHEMSIICFKPVGFADLCQNYGKNMGDRVLIGMGSASLDVFRETDHCCRMVKELFCCILMDTSSQEAYHAASRFGGVVAPPQEEILLSFQFGVAAFTENRTNTPNELLQLALNALEKAAEPGEDFIVINKRADDLP